MNRTLTASLLGLVALMAACSGAQHADHQAPTRRAREFFPLGLHAAWAFDSADADRGDGAGLVTLQVVRADGAGGFYVRQGSGASPPALYEYTADGVTRNGEAILREPIRAGARWRGPSGDAYVIRAVGLTRTVPAGTYRDVIEVVRTAGDATLRDGTEYRETFYYAPNVGPIEGVVPIAINPGDVRRFRLQLRGYTPNGEY